jgi:hypothetical protein
MRPNLVEWSDADERGQLAAIERTEFGQFGERKSPRNRLLKDNK